MKKIPKDVDAYIETAPKELQDKLRILREVIIKTVPDAKERISYSMPYYDYKGRLAYFAGFKKHISLFIPPPIIEEHKKELKNYHTAEATIHFPIDKPIPITLIKKLLKARMKYNEIKEQKSN